MYNILWSKVLLRPLAPTNQSFNLWQQNWETAPFNCQSFGGEKRWSFDQTEGEKSSWRLDGVAYRIFIEIYDVAYMHTTCTLYLSLYIIQMQHFKSFVADTKLCLN